MERSIIGIDLAKNVFQLHAEDATGHVLWRKRLRREELARFLAKQPPSLIGMEACATAHHWKRVRFPRMATSWFSSSCLRSCPARREVPWRALWRRHWPRSEER